MTLRFRDLGGAVLRANPRYELVVFDRLPEAERAACAPLRESPDFYGVLRSPEGALNVKSVSREAALLFYTLRDPGPLPGYAARLFGAGCDRAVAELVLDEVLEIEHGGAFVAGPDARPAVLVPESRGEADEGVLAGLSRAAFEYALRLPLDEPGRLTARLYFFNRLPFSPGARGALPSEEALAETLGLSRRGLPRELDPERWLAVPPRPGSEGWRVFARTGGEREAEPLRFKLYVSPRPEALAEVFAALCRALERQDAVRFKVGRFLPGVLRPDKLVAYFPSVEALRLVAADVLDEVGGAPVHGVPFTSEIGGDGLVSWGMDPPREPGGLEWQEQNSWRLWVASRLAATVLAARRAGAVGSAWAFARDRIRLEGVDPVTWTPRQSLWQRAG